MPPAPDKSFPRRERLKSKKRIARLFEQGKSGFVYPVRYVLLDDSAEESVAGKDRSLSVLISVPKRHHKRAVERNLLKRRMREAYRLNKQGLCPARARWDCSMRRATWPGTRRSKTP